MVNGLHGYDNNTLLILINASLKSNEKQKGVHTPSAFFSLQSHNVNLLTVQVLGVGPTSETSNESKAERGRVESAVRLAGATTASERSVILA